ncbi:MAG TPA: SMR family transporter [Burkholderiaceae bacterium]|nr:SMR family transporter [Burkholderiaceae bacterium]
MSPRSLLIILASVTLTALAQLALKLSSARHAGEVAGGGGLLRSLVEQFMNPWTIAGLLAYGLSFVLWLLALRDVPLTIAYPFMGLTLVLVAIFGVALLGETLGPARLFGMLLICAGLVLLARG